MFTQEATSALANLSENTLSPRLIELELKKKIILQEGGKQRKTNKQTKREENWERGVNPAMHGRNQMQIQPTCNTGQLHWARISNPGHRDSLHKWRLYIINK